jgi:hypothetical protein
VPNFHALRPVAVVLLPLTWWALLCLLSRLLLLAVLLLLLLVRLQQLLPAVLLCLASYFHVLCPAALQVDLSRSFDHCGVCGNSCAHDNAVTACVNNKCKLRSCMAPLVDCDGDVANGCEAVLASSVDNCGACKNVCSSAGNVVPTCTAGGCGWTDCMKGCTNCNGDRSDGCEVRGHLGH